MPAGNEKSRFGPRWAPAPGGYHASCSRKACCYRWREERIGTSPHTQLPGDLGDCYGARAADWRGPAAAELSTSIGSGSGFPRGPYLDDGGGTGGAALCTGQAAFAGRVDPDWTEAVPAIRANRGAHPRSSGGEGSGRHRRSALEQRVSPSVEICDRGPAHP